MSETKYTLIDVREPEEFDLGHLDGAINVPSESLMSGVPELKDVPKDTPLLLYCRTGSRSAIALNILKSLGFTNVINGINQQIAKQRFNL